MSQARCSATFQASRMPRRRGRETNHAHPLAHKPMPVGQTPQFTRRVEGVQPSRRDADERQPRVAQPERPAAFLPRCPIQSMRHALRYEDARIEMNSVPDRRATAVAAHKGMTQSYADSNIGFRTAAAIHFNERSDSASNTTDLSSVARAIMSIARPPRSARPRREVQPRRDARVCSSIYVYAAARSPPARPELRRVDARCRKKSTAQRFCLSEPDIMLFARFFAALFTASCQPSALFPRYAPPPSPFILELR